MDSSIITAFNEGLVASILVSVAAIIFIGILYYQARSPSSEDDEDLLRNIACWFYNWPSSPREIREAATETAKQIGKTTRRIRELKSDITIAFNTTVAALFLALIVTVLMIFQVIDADAGLPLVGSVLAFVVGKSSGSSIKQEDSDNPSRSLDKDPEA